MNLVQLDPDQTKNRADETPNPQLLKAGVFDLFPRELVIMILAMLPAPDILSARKSCLKLKKLSEEPQVAKRIAKSVLLHNLNILIQIHLPYNNRPLSFEKMRSISCWINRLGRIVAIFNHATRWVDLQRCPWKEEGKTKIIHDCLSHYTLSFITIIPKDNNELINVTKMADFSKTQNLRITELELCVNSIHRRILQKMPILKLVKNKSFNDSAEEYRSALSNTPLPHKYWELNNFFEFDTEMEQAINSSDIPL